MIGTNVVAYAVAFCFIEDLEVFAPGICPALALAPPGIKLLLARARGFVYALTETGVEVEELT